MAKNQLSTRNVTPLLPKELGNMTLNDLMSQPNVEISKKGNLTKVKNKTQNESVMLEIRQYPDVTTISQHRADKTKPVSQQTETVKQLRKEGKTQVETADILGTTQSNIAKIEKAIKKGK